MATFNGARYVAEQVHSILDQEVLPDELVVSDDGSDDDTLDVIRAVFSGRSETSVALKVVAGTHSGVTGNFERAIRATSGDHIFLCDQDDRWHPDRILAVEVMFEQDANLEFVHADAELIDGVGNPLGTRLLDALGVTAQERSAIHSGRALEVFIRRNVATGAASAFRKTLLQRALPFPSQWVHDEWLATLAAAAGTLALLEQPVTDYRQHGANEIGVSTQTLGYKLGRMLEPRNDHYAALAARFARLQDRMRDEHLTADAEGLLREKVEFESARADYPKVRIARLRPVLSQVRRGRYRMLSSQGSMDVLRDLVQPA